MVEKNAQLFNENSKDKKSESFNSDFYFDDIIKELSDAGFYNEEEKTDSSLEPLDKVEIIDTPKFDMEQLNSDIKWKFRELQNSFSQELSEVNKKIEKMKFQLKTDKETHNIVLKNIEENILLTRNENEESIQTIINLFKEKIAVDQTKDKYFEKLYSQLEDYKKGFVKSATKPLIHDLILLYDRFDANIKHFSNEENEQNANKNSDEKNVENENKFLSLLTMFKEELLEILSRQGIEKLPASLSGDKFNPEKSTVLKKIKTDEVEKDFEIKETVKEGFLQDGKSIRPESVIIYKNEII